MEYTVFKARLIEKLSELTDPDEEISVSTVTKNNGITLEVISIHSPGRGICPTINIREIKAGFDDGMTLPHLAKEVLSLCREKSFPEEAFRMELEDYENFRDKICFRAVNSAKNKELLEDVPFYPVLDLALVFYYHANPAEGLTGTVLVRNDDLVRWGITCEEIADDAFRNTPELEPVHFLTLSEYPPDGKIHILTNENRIYGASVMFYKNVCENLSSKYKRDLYILPSSIHEVLALPVSGNHCLEDLKEMVFEVNRAVLEETEVLSDEVYRWSRISGTLELA